MLVDESVAGEHRAGGEEVVPLILIGGHSATRFLYKQNTCRHVPGLKDHFPVGIKTTGGDVGKVDGCRAV